MALTIGGGINIGGNISISVETGVAIAVATSNTPFIVAYPFTTNGGFGTKYADPSTLPGTSQQSRRCAFNPAGTALAVGADSVSASNVDVYPFNRFTGFGTRYANPSTAHSLSSIFDVAWSPDGTVLAICGGSSPYVAAYQWTEGVGFGTKYANPASTTTISSSQLNGVAFNPAGTVIAVAGHAGSSQYVINAWPWSNSTGFGTRYTAPAAALQGWGTGGVAWSPSGSAVAATGNFATTSSALQVYRWSDSSGFGTQYTNPASVPTAAYGRTVTWSASGAALFLGQDTSPYLYAWSWSDSTGFGTQYSLPATSPPGSTVKSIAVRPGNNAVATASGSNTPPRVWTWTDSAGFGTKYSDPATWAGTDPLGVDFCP